MYNLQGVSVSGIQLDLKLISNAVSVPFVELKSVRELKITPYESTTSTVNERWFIYPRDLS